MIDPSPINLFKFMCPFLFKQHVKQRAGPLLLGFACDGMQIAIINSSSCCRSILSHNVVGSMALDNMVLVHSNVALEGMARNMDRDRSSSLLMRELKLP
jgi:hypothetical protein